MTKQAYRDEQGALFARIENLEERLCERERELAGLRAELDERADVFDALRGVVDPRRIARKRTRRFWVAAAAVLAVTATAGGALGYARAVAVDRWPISPAPAVNNGGDVGAVDQLPHDGAYQAPQVDLSVDPKSLCKTPSIHLNLGGADAVAVASGPYDTAGHHYRRGGDRSPWVSVRGGKAGEEPPIYVGMNGGYLEKDLGKTQLSILTIRSKGDWGAYVLADQGRSMLSIEGVSADHVWGRFEADVSKVKVAESARKAPFGAPVTRARGIFCLRRTPPNPNDTGP